MRVRAPVFVALACLLAIASVALPASPVAAERDRLVWTPIRTPSDDDFFVVTPSEVNVLKMGSSVIWYASDITNEKLYYTDDGGLSWTDAVTDALLDADPAPEMPVWDIAVAPDDPDFLAVVTSFDSGGVKPRQEVYVSEDGGLEWDCVYLTNVATWDDSLQISDIAISPSYSGGRDIAVCTRNPTDAIAEGDVWVTQSDAWSAWGEQDVEVDGHGLDVSAVAFSPDYAADDTIICVASDGTGLGEANDTYLWTGYRDTDTNSTIWNVTDPDYFELCEPDEDSPGESELKYCELAIPPEYSGDVASRRELYLFYASDTDNDDVYWVEDWDVHRLNVDRGTDIELASISYYQGNIMVGEIAADGATGRATIWVCREPEASFPSWYEAEKPPSGGFGTGIANAQVAVTPDGDWAICATSSSAVLVAADWADPAKWAGNAPGSPDESAISRADTGYGWLYWNQISLIDTDIDHLCDYSLWIRGDLDEEDPGNIIYLASQGTGLDSIWRTRAALMDDLGLLWERVNFTEEAGHDDILMRRTPADSPDDAVFYAIRGTNQAFKSLDEGLTWELVRECPEITDFDVVDSERLYVLDDNLLSIAQWTKIRRWYVWEWTHEIDTGLKSGFSLSHRGSTDIFVGDNGDEGEIAVSTNSGDTFEILPGLPEPGPVHVLPDEDYARNKLLYAVTEAATSNVYRWTLGGAVDWESLNAPDAGFNGLAQEADVLYAAFGEGVDRTLVPRAENVAPMDWDWLTEGLMPGTDFKSGTLRSLLVKDRVELWAIDSRAYDYDAEQGRLWVYSDTFALPTPWPTSPAIGEVLDCDSCACDACPFCFYWKELPKAEIYELWVALDERFKHVLMKLPDIDPVCCDAPGVCYFEIPFNFDCGGTYYWRVRATGTTEGEEVHTRWSPPMWFSVGAGTTVETMHVAPVPVAPEPGAQGLSPTPGLSWMGFPPTTLYELYLSDDEDFANVIVREEVVGSAWVYPGELPWGETYFWKVRALEPVTSEWLVASFTVIDEPVPAREMGPSPLQELPLGIAPQQTPLWVWVIIGSLILLIVLMILAAGIRRQERSDW